ncbi:MAG: hypothetical protein ACYC6F_16950 [Longimicrobiales bacterium]
MSRGLAASDERLTLALLVVTNRLGRSIWSFNVRAHCSGSWGGELLEGAILPGASSAWEVEPGIYHLRAETADGTRIQHFGLSVACGQLARWVVEEEGVETR